MLNSSEQFEQVWAKVDPMWKKGNKDDAQYFWLLGQKAANEATVADFQKARQQVEEAIDAIR